ncbi:MAG: YicC family protein [Bacteriovoracaceae bacterium]|nr:YicC family protein [Bacteriovoracaceae bacterium]
MTIQSMTGFGRGEISNDRMSAVVEIKSVNNRFRDIRFRNSSLLSRYELELKNKIGQKFKRGSFDVHIVYRNNGRDSGVDDLDNDKIAIFLKKIKDISEREQIPLHVRPCDFLRSEFYAERDEKMVDELISVVDQAADKALDCLHDFREVEGKKLVVVMKAHLGEFKTNLMKVEQMEKSNESSVKERLRKKFQEFSVDLKIDEPRFMQEVVYYLEKLDIHEEINRIKSHLSKLTATLNSVGEIGRQIDFLIQELNRETNTIGSKSGLNEISDCVVRMKIQLEKIREQGLNLE